MQPTVRLRSRPVRLLGAAMMVMSLAGLVSLGLDGAESSIRFGAPVLMFGVVGWGTFWKPFVEVSDGGITVANTLRTVEVPWPAVQAVDGRYGLRLRTALGPVTAWAAQAPSGRERARGQQSRAAQLVEERLELLRGQGHLDNPRLERPRAVVHWHRSLLGASAALTAAAVVLPLLG